MILFFRSKANSIYAVGSAQPLQNSDIQKLTWLFNRPEPLERDAAIRSFYWPQKRNDYALEYQCRRNHADDGHFRDILASKNSMKWQTATQNMTGCSRFIMVPSTRIFLLIHHLPDPIAESNQYRSLQRNGRART